MVDRSVWANNATVDKKTRAIRATWRINDPLNGIPTAAVDCNLFFSKESSQKSTFQIAEYCDPNPKNKTGLP
jgi:hypothetical protein